MLVITFHNDNTGSELWGNYDWKVLINNKVIAEGHLSGHNRSLGWKGLVKQFIEEREEDND